METFARILNKAMKVRRIKGDFAMVSHLLFGNDTRIFQETKVTRVLYLTCVLLSFQVVSNLTVWAKVSVSRLGEMVDSILLGSI